jgi:solute carrier family 35 protein F1/2
MLVGSDHLTDKSWQAADKVKGDLFMIAGATLYGFS